MYEIDLSLESSDPQSIHMMNPEDGSTQNHQAQDQDPTTVEEIDETTARYVQPPDIEPVVSQILLLRDSLLIQSFHQSGMINFLKSVLRVPPNFFNLEHSNISHCQMCC